MNKPRILIVDDDPNISRLVAMHLEKSGEYEVRTENRSFAAMEVARKFRPHLVLLDVDMPGKDGGQIAAELQASPEFVRTPVIFLTSLVSHDEAGDRAVIRGGSPFLAKPMNPAALDRTVKAMLARNLPAAA
jgi:DNA-binding response OmpR family regulator